MAKNFIQPGETIEYTAGGDIASGDVVVIGSLCGVAVTDIDNGETGIVSLEGVYELPKTTSLVITQGDEVFWSTGTSKVTKTATDKPIGTAHASETTNATTVQVKLYGRGNGTPVAATVAAVASPDGSSTGTTQTLANELKTQFNALLTSLKNAGIVASS